MPDVPTADRLRHDIDRGATGEKVDSPDPAAAPLGTDAEAGGNPPTAPELALEASSTNVSPRRARLPGIAIYTAAALAASAAVLAAAGLGAS